VAIRLPFAGVAAVERLVVNGDRFRWWLRYAALEPAPKCGLSGGAVRWAARRNAGTSPAIQGMSAQVRSVIAASTASAVQRVPRWRLTPADAAVNVIIIHASATYGKSAGYREAARPAGRRLFAWRSC
jgi:hypothetical protein